MQTGNFKTRRSGLALSSVEGFRNVKGSFRDGCKEVQFLRIVGMDGTALMETAAMDRSLTEQMGRRQGFYNRKNSLPKLAALEDVEFYSGAYRNWADSGKHSVSLKTPVQNQQLPHVISGACAEILGLLGQGKQGMNQSIEKNFIAKVLFWLDEIFSPALQAWKPDYVMKAVFANISKPQEYLFCYLLTLLGADVLLLQAKQDIPAELEGLGLSQKCVVGNLGQHEVPEYRPEQFQTRGSLAGNASGRSQSGSAHSLNQANAAVHRTQAGAAHLVVDARVPERDRRTREMLEPRHSRELDYEELAQLASSVVQIMIHDGRGNVIGGGSGIMVGRAGYILTNNHVACRGSYYSVRIEEDERVYQTDEMIKYNSVLDLAVIRIDRRLQPLPIYSGQKKLVRGQRVVAIGSPLGLFNSVSDGIISGFRMIEDVEMIQFTAPISSGSSGGAVLNMYGEVIGISTAGFDAGQNINLAVGHKYIGDFVRGFYG